MKGKAIFANTFREGLTTAEQRITQMFWMIEDPKHKLFELTVPLRAKDEWLKAMLQADSAGEESWDFYCFVQGLPTCNPGS